MANRKHNKPRGHNRTHVNEPPHPDTRYVVRDRDWERVWAVDLDHKAAHKLKEQITGRHLSRSVRYEPMPEDPELLEYCKDVRGIDTPAVTKPKRRIPQSPDARRPAAPPSRAAAQPEPLLPDSYEDDDADGEPDVDAELAAALGDAGETLDDLIGGNAGAS